MSSDMEIAVYTSALIHYWNDQMLPGLSCAKAFALLKYGALLSNDAYTNLYEAIRTIAKYQTNRVTSPRKKAHALEALELALEPYPQTDWFNLIPESERLLPLIQAHRDLHIGLRRDPENSIDLEAFGKDPQSVHRSSVQSQILKGLETLRSFIISKKQDAFNEILAEYMKHSLFRSKRTICYTLAVDYDTLCVQLETETVRYSELVDRVWAYIQTHTHRTELVKRLLEELEEGHAHCGNGKVARLMNVLVGFEETMTTIIDPKELFQNKIGDLVLLPLKDRSKRAQELFLEYNIDKEEWPSWLEALQEAD